MMISANHGIRAYRGMPVFRTDFMQGALDTRLTFTRASAAWCYNASGVLTQAAGNAPRFDYNPSTLALNGLLIEQQSTNLALQSNGFATSWSSGGIGTTVSANAATSPDGTNNAWLLSTGSSGYGEVNQTVNYTGAYNVSCYVKQNVGSSIYISGVTGSNTANYTFGGGFTYTGAGMSNGIAQYVGNGWYRISATVTNPSQIKIGSPYASTSFYIYGFQLEAVSFATSYIPTTATSVTRAVDSLANTGIGGWFNATQGTFIVEYISPPSTVNYPVSAAFTNGSSQRMDLQFSNNGGGSSAIILTNSSTGIALATSAKIKQGLAYKSGANIAAYNGTLYGAGTFGASSLPAGINQLWLGSESGISNTILNGWLQNFSYYNTALTSAQLQTISGQL